MALTTASQVAMLRCKTLIGRSLHARTLPTQKTETKVACKVINIMTGLDMPVFPPRGLNIGAIGEIRPHSDFCTNVLMMPNLKSTTKCLLTNWTNR
jgi:hypothetical protein